MRRPKRKGKRTPRPERNPNYRPHDYEPSWNPDLNCRHCHQALGDAFMPVRADGMEMHYECATAYFKQKKLEEVA